LSTWAFNQFFKDNLRTLILLAVLIVVIVVVLSVSAFRERLLLTLTALSSEGWTAVGTWVLVLGTLITVIWQARQQGRINSANTVMILHDRFESSPMKAYRKRLASALATQSTIKQRDDQILVFFETLGLLTHQKILNKEMVWNEFSWEVVRYYLALQTHITSYRSKSHDPTLYSEFEWLFNCLIYLDCKKRGVSPDVATPNEGEIQEFIEDESELSPTDEAPK
jgi:hypothetical protein